MSTETKGKTIEDLSDRELQENTNKLLRQMIQSMKEFSSILYDIMSEDMPEGIPMPEAEKLKDIQKKLEEEHVPGYQ